MLVKQIEQIQSKIKHQDIQLIKHTNLNTLKQFFDTIDVHESMKTIPMFDPSINKSLNENNSFWFELIKHDKRIGCIAAKTWQTENILNDIHTLKTWYENGDNTRYRIVNRFDSMPKLSGLWSTGGKLWLDPSVRKTGLSKLLTILIRAEMAVEYNTIGHFCIIKQPLVQKEVDVNTYLYNKPSTLTLQLVDTKTDEKMSFFSNYITLDEINSQSTISL